MLFRILQTILPISLAFGNLTFAENLNIAHVMHISYNSPSWNTDSTKIDSAFLVMRDKASGKFVQIQLEETEPDSSQFVGHFSVNIGDEKIPAEVYIPPKELRGSDKDGKKLYEMISAGKLPRKPVIWKKNEKGQAELQVYDTREQAEAGLKSFEAEMALAQELRRKKPLKPMTNENAMAAAVSTERKAQFDKLAAQAAQRAQERANMEQIERQKAAERAAQARNLSEAERAANKAKAAKVNAEALALFNRGDFSGAEAKFKQAVDLDPENKDYYFKYGITLYRNQKNNEALVALKLAKVEPAQELERKFYIGLVHYRLSEFDNALKQFDEVVKSDDPNMAPPATFYAGVVYFSQEKYDAAKKNFEKVIDTSKDPALDQQAEDYLDRVSSAMAYQKMRENKFTLMGTVGLSYDSNVLFTADSATTPTDKADFRFLTVADLQYRPVFTEKHEWAPHFTVNLTNSAKNESAPGDPFVYTVASPYSRNGKLFAKNNRFTVTPGYELLYMDPTNTGTKTEQMESYYLTFDNMVTVNPSLVSIYTFDYRKDDSKDVSSNGPADADSNKYTLRTIQSIVLDKNKKQSLMPALGYIWNNAVGMNKTYNRYDLGVTYAQPIPWSLSWNINLAYFNLTYPNLSPVRTDNNYMLTTGITKPIKDWVIWGLSANYTKNGSSDQNFTYTKYMITTTATFLTNF